MVGYGHALRDEWMDPGLFWTNIAVAQVARRQGIGSTIHNALLDWARPQGATSLLATVYEHVPQSVRFAEHHGYQIERHVFESTLDLSVFDEQPLLGALDAAQAAGIRFATMADVGDTEAARRKLWEVESITGVLPAYRGRGIALALKLLAIRAARQDGVRYLRTNNDAENVPMLAVNCRLGYRPEPGYFRMRARLATSG